VKSGATVRFIWVLYILGAIGPLMIILAAKEMVSSARSTAAGSPLAR
jgi:hypothetical protein